MKKIKQIWKGGSKAPLINGLSTANCGAQFINDEVIYEAMSKEYSSHPTNIISLYLPNENKKVEISIWLLKDNDYENAQFGIAYYPSYTSVHSSKYTQKISSKWEKYKSQLIETHKTFFNGKSGE